MKDLPRSGCPRGVANEDLLRLVEEDPTISIKKIAAELKCSTATVSRGLALLGKSIDVGGGFPINLPNPTLSNVLQSAPPFLFETTTNLFWSASLQEMKNGFYM